MFHVAAFLKRAERFVWSGLAADSGTKCNCSARHFVNEDGLKLTVDKNLPSFTFVVKFIRNSKPASAACHFAMDGVNKEDDKRR